MSNVLSPIPHVSRLMSRVLPLALALAATTAVAAPGAAGGRMLVRGLGLWLVRCGESADVAKPF